MNKSAVHEKGFSMIELLIYVSILSVLSLIFVGVLTNLSFSWTRSKVESEVQQNIRIAIETISQTVRNASRITAPSAGSSGSSLTAIVNGQTVVYSLSGTTLQRQIDSIPPEAITTDKVRVTYLNFLTTVNNATTTGSVVTATATTTQFALTVDYNATGAQFSYTQSATSTQAINQ